MTQLKDVPPSLRASPPFGGSRENSQESRTRKETAKTCLLIVQVVRYFLEILLKRSSDGVLWSWHPTKTSHSSAGVSKTLLNGLTIILFSFLPILLIVELFRQISIQMISTLFSMDTLYIF